MLHLQANITPSPSLIDLSSTFIPFEDEEEEEGPYDDIEGVTHLPPPGPGPAQASRNLRPGGGREAGEVYEEDEDIYEVLPGTRRWSLHSRRPHTETQTGRCCSPEPGTLSQTNGHALLQPSGGVCNKNISVMSFPGCDGRVARCPPPSPPHPGRSLILNQATLISLSGPGADLLTPPLGSVLSPRIRYCMLLKSARARSAPMLCHSTSN